MGRANAKKVRSVLVYLSLLENAGRSKNTINGYRKSLGYYAKFLNVPIGDLHNHLTMDNLLAFTNDPLVKDVSRNTRRTWLQAIYGYMKANGIEFDHLEKAVVTLKKDDIRHDKPLEFETLQKMVDLADVQMKAYITFLVSTGCRSGEASEVLLSDVKGSVITIRPEIAKARHGGKVFLSAEAREYLDLWLQHRDKYVKEADLRTKNFNKLRPEDDQRLFASTANNLQTKFGKLYCLVDGQKCAMHHGNRKMITPHSCRAYFRTHAVQTMEIDMVERLMRHTGYLTAAYVQMTDKELERRFHEGEHVLYITRANHRIQVGKLSDLERRNADLTERLAQVEKAQQTKEQAELQPEYQVIYDRVKAELLQMQMKNQEK
jgi:integrase